MPLSPSPSSLVSLPPSPRCNHGRSSVTLMNISTQNIIASIPPDSAKTPLYFRYYVLGRSHTFRRPDVFVFCNVNCDIRFPLVDDTLPVAQYSFLFRYLVRGQYRTVALTPLHLFSRTRPVSWGQAEMAMAPPGVVYVRYRREPTEYEKR